MPDCFEIGSVKLIVWDLDGTFWEGTLSEGDVAVPKERVKLLEDLTDCGIINSICSRNDFKKAKARLEEASVWDLFVSPSISWEAKGPRLKQLLESLSLRPANTLFIDDNPSNRGEAGFYLPGIQTASPEVLETIAVQLTKLERSDPERSRLAHYKTLERRNTAFKASTSSEQFLYDSDIQVSICHDCMQHKERILELINRTNQLNFTKKKKSTQRIWSRCLKTQDTNVDMLRRKIDSVTMVLWVSMLWKKTGWSISLFRVGPWGSELNSGSMRNWAFRR